jgi:hypothetical protein
VAQAGEPRAGVGVLNRTTIGSIARADASSRGGFQALQWTFSLDRPPYWWCNALNPSFLHEGFQMRFLGLLLLTLLISPIPVDFQGRVVSTADGDGDTVLCGREAVKVLLTTEPRAACAE